MQIINNIYKDFQEKINIKNFLFYFILLIIIFLFFLYIYIKIKYKFWSIQPVFHIYNIIYMLNPPGIINEELPLTNKYTNLKNIDTYPINKLNDFYIKKFINLIKINYLQNKDNIFNPNKENILPYFNSQDENCFISFYKKKINLIDEKNNIINEDKIIGAITSRPVNILINNCNSNEKPQFKAYYVDYLCVDKLHRRQGIAPELIQTHHYKQSHINKNISISIFKREDDLNLLVPIVAYQTFGFEVLKWSKPNDLELNYKILEINSQNLRFCYDFIEENKEKFDIIINTCLTNLIELIKTKNIYINCILCDNKIICCYFFRKTCIEIEKNIEVLTCFASISNCENNIFIRGFKISFWKIAYENNYGYAAIENISHNNILINNIILKTKPSIISPCAYYFYNFAYPTFKANKSLIIN